MRQLRWRHVLLGLGTTVGLVAIASCSSVEPSSGGGRIEYAGSQVSAPPSSAQGPSPTSSVGPLSPLDWAIRNDWPPRPWSKNVPNRACTEDSECGDGFCDRDHCAAIWTSSEEYGQRCYGPWNEKSGSCRGLCLEGRCRTCLSDDECVKALGTVHAVCNPYPDRSGGHMCGFPGPKGHE